jgi:hypothetical protein
MPQNTKRNSSDGSGQNSRMAKHKQTIYQPTSKTKFILFRSSKKKKRHVVKLSINNDGIKQVKSTTFLGVVIDECLSWNDHIDSVAKKIVKSAGTIAKIRHFTNLNTQLKLIYYALVYLYLIYGNLIWSKGHVTRCNFSCNLQCNSTLE